MEAFREFIREFGPQHFGVALPINLLVNSCAMWFVVNHMVNTGEKKEPFLRCLLCAALLYGVSVGAILLLQFPTAVVFILAGVTWLAGSIFVIHGVFQMQWGGAVVLFVYLIVLVGIHQLVKMIMG